MSALALHYEHEAADLRAQVAAERRYRQRLARHPDPRDPDYPGDLPEDAVQEMHRCPPSPRPQLSALIEAAL